MQYLYLKTWIWDAVLVIHANNMSTKSELYSKVSCCFAKQVYHLYQQKRYGINYCNKVDPELIHSTNRLMNLFKFKTAFQPECYLDNFNTYDYKPDDVCNMATIIEKINTL